MELHNRSGAQPGHSVHSLTASVELDRSLQLDHLGNVTLALSLTAQGGMERQMSQMPHTCGMGY